MRKFSNKDAFVAKGDIVCLLIMLQNISGIFCMQNFQNYGISPYAVSGGMFEANWNICQYMEGFEVKFDENWTITKLKKVFAI